MRSEQGSRFWVQNCERFKRVKVKTANISIHLPGMGKARYRTSCFTNISPGSNLHVMETRSFLQRKGCVADPLDRPQWVRFSQFLLIGGVLSKFQSGQATLIFVTPAWQAQSWFAKLLQMSVRTPLLLPKDPELLLGPNKETHSLIEKKSLQLLSWTVSRKNYLQKELQKNILLLLQMQGEKVQTFISNWSGVG